MTGANLDRRFRRRWLGYEPADVEAALRAADARVAELDRALAAQTQELERLRAEVGRAYTAEAGIARALVVAEQVGATLKDQAAAEADATRRQAQADADRVLREAHTAAAQLLADARAEARALVAAAERDAARWRAARDQVFAETQAVLTLGREAATTLLGRVETWTAALASGASLRPAAADASAPVMDAPRLGSDADWGARPDRPAAEHPGGDAPADSLDALRTAEEAAAAPSGLTWLAPVGAAAAAPEEGGPRDARPSEEGAPGVAAGAAVPGPGAVAADAEADVRGAEPAVGEGSPADVEEDGRFLFDVGEDHRDAESSLAGASATAAPEPEGDGAPMSDEAAPAADDGAASAPGAEEPRRLSPETAARLAALFASEGASDDDAVVVGDRGARRWRPWRTRS